MNDYSENSKNQIYNHLKQSERKGICHKTGMPLHQLPWKSHAHQQKMHSNPYWRTLPPFICQLLKRLYSLHLKWPQCAPYRLGRLIMHNSSCTIWAIWQRFFLLRRHWSPCISYQVRCTFVSFAVYLSHTWPVTQIAHSVPLSFSLFPGTYSQAIVEWIHNLTW